MPQSRKWVTTGGPVKYAIVRAVGDASAWVRFDADLCSMLTDAEFSSTGAVDVLEAVRYEVESEPEHSGWRAA